MKSMTSQRDFMDVRLSWPHGGNAELHVGDTPGRFWVLFDGYYYWPQGSSFPFSGCHTSLDNWQAPEPAFRVLFPEMSRPGGRGNPWNRSGGDRKKRVENGWTDGPSRSPAVPDAMSAQNKFQEAHLKMQKSVQKYMRQEYESSSEEEELESDNILGTKRRPLLMFTFHSFYAPFPASVLKNYNSFGGKSEDLGRTQNVLENSFRSGSAVCLICIALIKRTDSVSFSLFFYYYYFLKMWNPSWLKFNK